MSNVDIDKTLLSKKVFCGGTNFEYWLDTAMAFLKMIGYEDSKYISSVVKSEDLLYE